MGDKISYHMIESPHTIGSEQTLETASTILEEFNIRHLPVLHGGKLVGILSDRDIEVVRALIDEEPELITVEEAMTPEVYSVESSTEASRVFRYMASHKIGSAIIVDGGQVKGVFTCVDALRTLADLFDAEDIGTAS